MVNHIGIIYDLLLIFQSNGHASKLEEEDRKRKASQGKESERVVSHKQENGGEVETSPPAPAEGLLDTGTKPKVPIPPPDPTNLVSEKQSRDEKILGKWD